MALQSMVQQASQARETKLQQLKQIQEKLN